MNVPSPQIGHRPTRAVKQETIRMANGAANLIEAFLVKNPKQRIIIGDYLIGLDSSTEKITILNRKNGYQPVSKNLQLTLQESGISQIHLEAVQNSLNQLNLPRDTIKFVSLDKLVQKLYNKNPQEVDQAALAQLVTPENILNMNRISMLNGFVGKYASTPDDKKPAQAEKIRKSLAEAKKIPEAARDEEAKGVIAKAKAILAAPAPGQIAPGGAAKGKPGSKDIPFSHTIYILSNGTSIFNNGKLKIKDITDNGKFTYEGKEINLNDGIQRDEATALGFSDAAYNFHSSGGEVGSAGDGGITEKDFEATHKKHIDQVTDGLSESAKKDVIQQYVTASKYILVPAKEAAALLLGGKKSIIAEDLVSKYVSKGSRATAKRVIANILGKKYDGNKELSLAEVQSFLATMGFLSQVSIDGYPVDNSSFEGGDKASGLLSNAVNLLAWLKGEELKEGLVDEATGISASDPLPEGEGARLALAKKLAVRRQQTDEGDLQIILAGGLMKYIKKKSKADDTLVFDRKEARNDPNFAKLEKQWEGTVKPYYDSMKKEQKIYEGLIDSQDPAIRNYARIQLAKLYAGTKEKNAAAKALLGKVTKDKDASSLLKAQAYLSLGKKDDATKELDKLYNSEKGEFAKGVKDSEKAAILYYLAQTKLPTSKGEKLSGADYFRYLGLMKAAKKWLPKMSDNEPLKVDIQKSIEKLDKDTTDILPGQIEFEQAKAAMDIDKLEKALPDYMASIQAKIKELDAKPDKSEDDKKKLYGHYVTLYQMNRNLGKYAAAKDIAKKCGTAQRDLKEPPDAVNWDDDKDKKDPSQTKNCEELAKLYDKETSAGQVAEIVFGNFVGYSKKAKQAETQKKMENAYQFRQMALYAALEFQRRTGEAKAKGQEAAFWKGAEKEAKFWQGDFEEKGYYGGKIKKGRSRGKRRKFTLPKLKPYYDSDPKKLTAYFKVMMDTLKDVKKPQK